MKETMLREFVLVLETLLRAHVHNRTQSSQDPKEVNLSSIFLCSKRLSELK